MQPAREIKLISTIKSRHWKFTCWKIIAFVIRISPYVLKSCSQDNMQPSAKWILFFLADKGMLMRTTTSFVLDQHFSIEIKIGDNTIPLLKLCSDLFALFTPTSKWRLSSGNSILMNYTHSWYSHSTQLYVFVVLPTIPTRKLDRPFNKACPVIQFRPNWPLSTHTCTIIVVHQWCRRE